jgi:methylase of polypeptide subunit release factors
VQVRILVLDFLHNLINADLQHHLYLLTYDGQLSVIPDMKDKNFQRVLDVGTGTGIWAIDYGMSSGHFEDTAKQRIADENPLAEVLGIDISPDQPS